MTSWQSRSLSDIDRFIPANDGQASTLFSVPQNPQRIPVFQVFQYSSENSSSFSRPVAAYQPVLLRLVTNGTVGRLLAHIIHERFRCSRGFAAATSLLAGRLALQFLIVLAHVGVGPSRLRVPVSKGGCAILRRTAMKNVSWLGLVSPHTSVRPNRRESSGSYGICALVPYTFLLENCILVKLHGLCCLPIGQCVRCCGTAWYWSLIHMIIHNPCTPFVDTESGGAEVLPHCRLFLCGASWGWERKTCLEATFQCRRPPLYHGVSR